MDIPWLVSLEGAVLGLGSLALQLTQVAHPVPTQATIQPRARYIRVQKLPHHRQKIVQGKQQRLAQRDCHGLLRRRQGCLKAMWRVAFVLHAVTVTPLINRLLRNPVSVSQNPCSLIAGLDLGADFRGGRRLAMQSNKHLCLRL